MLIVAIDTSGKSGGITLAEGDSNSFRVLESSPIAGGTFSAQLVPTLTSLLQKHEVSPHELGGFVAASGPGSFTGLRVGLAAIKGLAEVLKKPVAIVSVLEALAVSLEQAGKVAAVLDAGRGEMFFGLYDICGDRVEKLDEQLLSQNECLAAIKRERPACVVAGDPSIVSVIESAGVQIQHVARPGTEVVARIGLRKLQAGDTVSVEELDANYLRRSDAEIFSKPAQKQ
jgi:tRNA threonylcarbamoyladenosine biosynthesis protein TsaB